MTTGSDAVLSGAAHLCALRATSQHGSQERCRSALQQLAKEIEHHTARMPELAEPWIPDSRVEQRRRDTASARATRLPG